jgi:hypothetical protein
MPILYFPTWIICFIIIKMYIILLKKIKSAYSYCPNYILNDILSDFMVNKKVKHKNAARGKNNIYSLTLPLWYGK